MSFTITTDVFCDQCNDWTSGTSTIRPNRSQAWKIARARGWTKKDGKHLCPRCNGKAWGKSEYGYYWNKAEYFDKYGSG